MAMAALTGLSYGALHAVSGPDHVLSLAPLSVQRPRGAWRIGLTWGLGHAAGTVLAALVLLALVSLLHLPGLESWAERVAGVALVVTGVLGIRRHVQAQRAHGAAAHSSMTQVFAVGCLHGVTGAVALLLLLPLAISGSVAQRWLYLVGFSVGSTAAMALLTGALAALHLARGAGVAKARWTSKVPQLASLASVALGLVWLVG